MTTAPSVHYVPGVCNIGSAEIARRRRSAWAATIVTIALYAVLVILGTPHVFRLGLALPAAAAAITWLQVRERFCVAFGSAGVFNLGPVGTLESVADQAARRADRRKAMAMVLQGVAIGVVLGVLACFVP
jgi:hypothetical protein